jgi:hypothetical protein
MNQAAKLKNEILISRAMQRSAELIAARMFDKHLKLTPAGRIVSAEGNCTIYVERR